MTTYEADSLHTPESRERDFRLVGHEPKGSKMAERDALEAENQRLREALISIASNSCCDRCQEASLVARAALTEQEIDR